MTGIRRRLALLLALLSAAPTAYAHRLDEYLQATLVSIEPGDMRLHINLTPGVAVADAVLALIDGDHDGVISNGEAATYAELLKRDLTVRLDDRKVGLTATSSNAPPAAELRSGWGIIQAEFTLSGVPPLAAGAHRLTVENRHLPAVSVYLFNAVKPKSEPVRIARQVRNDNQSTGSIEFTVGQPPRAFGAAATGALLAALLVAVSATIWHRARSLSTPRPRTYL